MNATEAFIKHVETVTSHSEVYTRGLLNCDYWVVVLSNDLYFLTTTDMVMPDDCVLKTGTHMECVEYIIAQFNKEH